MIWPALPSFSPGEGKRVLTAAAAVLLLLLLSQRPCCYRRPLVGVAEQAASLSFASLPAVAALLSLARSRSGARRGFLPARDASQPRAPSARPQPPQASASPSTGRDFSSPRSRRSLPARRPRLLHRASLLLLLLLLLHRRESGQRQPSSIQTEPCRLLWFLSRPPKDCFLALGQALGKKKAPLGMYRGLSGSQPQSPVSQKARTDLQWGCKKRAR